MQHDELAQIETPKPSLVGERALALHAPSSAGKRLLIIIIYACSLMWWAMWTHWWAGLLFFMSGVFLYWDSPVNDALSTKVEPTVVETQLLVFHKKKLVVDPSFPMA